MRAPDFALRDGPAVKLVFAALLLGCALWSLARPAPAPLQPRAAHAEWPAQWDGRTLRPLALGDVDRRFAARFPGAVARLTDGERQFVMRAVDEPTRMLHPAADCYRASGYRIDATRLESDTAGRRWRCFDARRDGDALRVCERIVDADGTAFTDTSAWFWAALAGRSRGPWQAVTMAEALR